MENFDGLLLDTHTFLWMSFAPHKLSKNAREWVTDGRTKLFLSVVSLWEIEVKHRSGQLQAEARVVDGSMRALGVRPIAISTEHVRVAAQMRASGARDPFDWMIAAQAAVERLPLVTGDEGFAGMTGVELRW